MFDHPYLDSPGPLAFAHRGGNREAPENTAAAFHHAVSLGYRYLETDVHLTADGLLAAFHDPDLQRTCGVEAKISELTWSEIAALRVDEREPIPLMSELLERWPDRRFNIDCKSDDAVEALATLIDTTDAIDRVCLGAFSLRRLTRLRKLLGPRLLTSMSPAETASLRLFGRLAGDRPRAAQVPPSQGPLTVVDERFVARAHRRGIPVHVWTINEADEMHRLLDMGVDGVMTDDVALLKQVFVERGLWND